MRAGLLRYNIEIQTETTIKSDSGFEKETWINFATTKANVINMGGKKGLTDDQIQNSRVTEFTIRHNIKVTESMRIIYNGIIYKINYINLFITNGNQIIGAEFEKRV